MANFYGKYPVVGAGSSVTTIDGISGAVTLVGGTGITITDNAPVAGSITIASSSSGDVTIGAFGSTPNANGLSISGSQVLNMQPADATHPGGISVADWNTFNNKQAAGSYITALTGGVTASGPGSAAATVVTNANLTGPITSVGNATALAAQTGTGSVFVVQNTPTLTTPNIGAATGTSLSVSGQLTSTVATGTAPLVVSSTTQVANLNAATAGSATTATTATNATNVATTQVSNSASYFPLMVSSSTNGNQACDLGTGLTFNPSTNVLTTTTFSGALSGNATTATSATSATTATNATNTAITDDTTTNATMYPTWVTTTTGNLPQKVSSTKLTFNPSTAALTTTTFVGALTGTASGNTTYSANNHGLVVSSTTNAMTVVAPDSSTTKVLTSGGASADPTWAAVTGSSFATQTANFVFAGPASGAVAAPTFRAQVPLDGLGIFPVDATAKTSNYTLTTTDYFKQGNASGGAFTFTLPTAIGAAGQRYVLARTDQTLANIITINTTSSQTINGALTKHLATQWERWVLASDGANWLVESHTYPAGMTNFTPSLTTSGGGNITLNGTSKLDPNGYWWRLGSQMYFLATFKNGSGGAATGTAGNVQMGLPVTPDTTQMINNSGFGYGQGTGEFLDGSNYKGRTTAFASGSSISINKIGTGGAITVADLVASASMYIQANVPVASWDE